MMTPLSHLLPPLPGFTALPQTYAPWPVWSDSTTPRSASSHAQEGRRAPLAPRPRLRPRHAPAWPAWRRRRPHRAAGAARADLRLPEPPHRPAGSVATQAIARKAGVCVRTVATALARLRELGILNWVRRCAESWRDGRFVLEQQTNAYAVLPESQWRGYRPPQEPPAPAPGTWGEPAPMPSVLAQAARKRAICGPGGRDPRQRSEGPAGACAGEPRAGVHGAQLVSFTGVHEMQRNIPQL